MVSLTLRIDTSPTQSDNTSTQLQLLNMKIIHYYRRTETPHSLLPSIKEQLSQSSNNTEDASKILSIDTESCFNVQLENDKVLDTTSTQRLEWLLRETFEKDGLKLESSSFDENGDSNVVIMEFGPRMTFTSAFSSNATSICAACGLTSITRLERSKRYRFTFSSTISSSTISAIKRMLHDRMTEEEYATPISTFDSGAKVEPVVRVPIMEEGRSALEKINKERGLGFDDFDLDYYTQLFKVSGYHIVVYYCMY